MTLPTPQPKASTLEAQRRKHQRRVLRALRRRRFTPRPGTPSVDEMLRADRRR